ncbi:UNVERIFIED_CONTAM: Carotenoid 9,10(9',10')-cleavage dioxygenase 1 [Sesamum radiatum]|uniref:Carotenoid 9,10(9',10')-cleavage dioxygenase 1 n=1 Tax=Sesamum radiatum TaxID=300843 RepID=A0AAW2L021_SESRA
MATSYSYYAFPLMISCTAESRPRKFGLPRPSTSSASAAYKVMKLIIPYHPQISTIMDLPRTIKEIPGKLLDALVDHVFEFVDQPYLPSQSNFAPVDEIGEPVRATVVHGSIPHDLPEGVYIRNGSNPLHGVPKSAVSIFGKSSNIWVEGEGMIHALYFNKDDSSDGNWTTFYNNKYVSTDTFELEKERKKPVFLPATEGDSAAVLSAFLLNLMRFGVPNKNMSNTNVFEHAGKHYTISENDVAPYEIDIRTLETLGTWDHDIARSWNRPFTSHPKRAPCTGELVTIGIDARKPYLVLGVISADGTKLLHKVDLKFERSVFCHEIGVTQRYNVIMDFPTTIDLTRLLRGGSIIIYEKEKYARIGIMPRYGDADSVRWFEVETCCTFHIINCYEEDNEVVVMGCTAPDSIIPGPDLGKDKFGWFSRGFKKSNSNNHHRHQHHHHPQKEGFLFARPYEWRLNIKTGQVKEKYLVAPDFALDFPFINHNFTGLENKYAYTQVVDSAASSAAGMVKYGGLAKVCLQEKGAEEYRKIEYHMFPENTFCTGASFVAKQGAADEDDGWLITFVHNEDTNTSEVYIVDAKNISSEAVAKIRLPGRVPYGYHGAYMPIS